MVADVPAGEHSSAAHHSSEQYQNAILLIAFGLCLGALTRAICQKWKIPIPYTVLILLLGVLIHGIPDDGLEGLSRASNSFATIDPHFLLNAFIPALIFESAFGTHYHTFKRVFLQVCCLLSSSSCCPSPFFVAGGEGACCVTVLSMSSGVGK